LFRLSSLILLLPLLVAAVVRAQPAATQSAGAAPAQVRQYRVILITLGPGDAIWEKFGHNMIDIRGAFDEPVSYHWGIFDFDQPGFVRNFLQGRMTYMMGAVRTLPTLDEYRKQDRDITYQDVPLTKQQFIDLILRCEQNRRPENCQYKYDYFKDNCSTRVRDALNEATGGELKRVIDTQRPTGLSYRGHTLRLMQDEFWMSLGLDYALGPACDRPLTSWEETFLPMQLAKSAAPMLQTLPPPWTATRAPEHQSIPNRTPGLAIAGLALAGAVVAFGSRVGRWPRRIAGTVMIFWLVLSGFGGVFNLYIWLLTDHVAGYANQNLLHFSPLAWVMIVMLIVLRRSQRRRAAETASPGASSSAGGTAKPSAPRTLRAVAVAIVLISAVGLLLNLATVLSQDNLRMILLALPLNLAVAWWAWRLTRTPAADQLTTSLSKS
jgi:hypothetical protein